MTSAAPAFVAQLLVPAVNRSDAVQSRKPPEGGPWNTGKIRLRADASSGVVASLGRPGHWPDASPDSGRFGRRATGWAFRNALRPEQTRDRVQACGHRTTGGGVALHVSSSGSAFWRGLVTCGSVWECPSCAAKISAERAREVSQAVDAWGQDRCGLITLTLRHVSPEALADVLKALLDAFRDLGKRQQRDWKKLRERYGLYAQIRALEDTHGKHGWHPHLHIVAFFETALTPEQYADFERELTRLWQRAMGRHSAKNMPTKWNGVKVCPLRSSGYITKLGLEVASAWSKPARGGNRSPWQIAADLVWHGRDADRALWREYVEAMRGHRQLFWSPGFRAELGLDEKKDEELAEAEETEEKEAPRVLLLAGAEWRKLRWLYVDGVHAPLAFMIAAASGATPDELASRLAQLLARASPHQAAA